MAERGLDGLLLTWPKNVGYLSGFTGMEALARPSYLLVSQRGKPVLLVHEAVECAASRRAQIADVRPYKRLSVAPLHELARAVRDLGLARGRIGAELGFEQRIGIPVAEFELLRAELEPADIIDGSDLVWQLRMVKEPDEVESIRRACAITARAYEHTFAQTVGGDTERSVANQMKIESLRDGASDTWVAIVSGRGNYDVVLGLGETRQLSHGDLVWMDAGCSVDGYWSDFGRGGVVGGPSREQEEAQRLVHEVTTEGVGMVAPGVPVKEIASHCRERIEALGLPVESWVDELAGRIGHGLGLDVTEPPHISEESSARLRPGMVITIEPAVTTAFGIFHIEQNVLVTESGHQLLSTCPWELRMIPERRP